tara:strand:+ start:209 stop:466 length:258 start_codon:yes stop_codon:yes gene_type:complete
MYTKHALIRGQQRGIEINTVETVINYGDEYQRNGGHIYLCKKAAIKAMTIDGLSHHQIEKCSSVYVVVENGVVKTVAHKTKKFKF